MPLAIFVHQTPTFVFFLVALALAAVGFFVAADRPPYPSFHREFTFGICLAFLAFGVTYGPAFFGTVNAMRKVAEENRRAEEASRPVPSPPDVRELLENGNAVISDIRRAVMIGDHRDFVLKELGRPVYDGNGYLHYRASDGAVNIVLTNDEVVEIQQVPPR